MGISIAVPTPAFGIVISDKKSCENKFVNLFTGKFQRGRA